MKSCYPEAHLCVLSSALTHHSALFINVELLQELCYQWPRRVDDEMYFGPRAGREGMRRFAVENPGLARHLETQERVEVLEGVMRKLSEL